MSTDIEHTPLTALRGVGPRLAARVERLGLRTVSDLLLHLPLRYEDRTRLAPIGTLRAGDRGVVEAEVQHAEVVVRRRRMLVVRIADGTGFLTLRFFHFTAAQQQGFVRGVRLRCFGEVRAGVQGLEMVHPEYRPVETAPATATAEHLTPVYPATAGVHQLTLRRLCQDALCYVDQLQDWLPEPLRRELDLPALAQAVAFVHRPPPDADLAALQAGRHPAQRRLAFEELLAHHLSLRRLRAAAEHHAAPAIDVSGGLAARLVAALPFRLTSAQERVVAEIRRDLARDHPMQRLVQGDVGSGKTVVAAIAALYAVEAGYQAAVMAPTEILAEQHLRSLGQWLAPLGCEMAWLSGRQRAAERREALARVASGAARVVVGTHALFQEEVGFHDLALVIIDEQHRFGVHQRLALREKGVREGRFPHQLIMTATPIPRTLAMTAYADLDVSLIDERPPGRRPIRTVALPEGRRAEVVARIRHACREGRQAYWVCTLIEESEALQAQAAEETARQLSAALPDLRIGLVHGRMRPDEKAHGMNAFKGGEIDLLVATTVIEVGVDVPNASLMIIENAERLGLAQLHQLRGRVGRGTRESSCLLLYHPPLSEAARHRLAVVRETDDGFRIAEADLAQRGPGEVLGTRQTGMIQFRIADLARDADLLTAVRHTADHLLHGHPDCAMRISRRWIGEAAQYGEV